MENSDLPAHDRPALTASTTLLMAFSVGVIVANIYYIQPLLADIAKNFRITEAQVGVVAVLTQIGAATGMFIFVPLGDSRERRSLITALLVAASVALALTASAQNLIWLSLSSLIVGATASMVHLIVPLAASLALPEQRGRVVGTVLGGLLFGILLARTFSGYVGENFGWRTVYWISSVMMLMLAVLVRFQFPLSRPQTTLPWLSLIRSLWGLIREQPILREAAFQGAMLFGAFSAFWTTLVFLLEAPPYHYGSTVAGLFGLVGAAGAAGAPVIGHIADRYGPRRTVLFAITTTIIGFVILAITGKFLAGLIVGVILLDLGVQSGHVSNQSRIYSLAPEARSRLNTVYMVCYFIGGALGSYGSVLGWRHYGWVGVCIFALCMLLLAMMPFLLAKPQE